VVVAAGGHDDAVRVWEAGTGALLFATRPVDGLVRGLEIDGEVLVALAGDGAVYSWRLPRGSPLATVRSGVAALAIAGDTILGAGGMTTVDLPHRSE
jgi:hypothetical protein